MLELAILGLLKEQPLHGYELKKRLGETLGSLWGISYGSLYPALRRLEHDGSIESVEPDTVAAPMPATGSLDGDLAAARLRRPAKATRRTRKAYRLTEQGDARFSQLLLDDDTARRRRTDLRVEARVLPPPRSPRRGSSCSPGGAPRSPTGSPGPAARHPAAATATRARCSSTAPIPPNEISNGSTR